MALTPSPSADPTTPTPTFTGGIDPPTEPPEAFSEFAIPHPDDLTEQYAAWVLAEIYRAEDRLIKMTVNAPDKDLDKLPKRFTTALESLYGGVRLENEIEGTLRTIRRTPQKDVFLHPPGKTRLSNIELLDATQECLILRYVRDSRTVVKGDPAPGHLIVLLEPKPEIDASRFNRTPWLMLNRAPPEDVTGDRCPS